MIYLKNVSHLAGLVAIGLFAVMTGRADPGEAAIAGVLVNQTAHTITIQGTNLFGQDGKAAPAVFLNGVSLTVGPSPTASQITATFPTTLAPGTYLLSLIAPHNNGRDEGDSNPIASFDVAIGAIGPQGPQGIQGPMGLTGAQGLAGVTGVQGPKGDTGATGAIGPQGPQGIQGQTGVTGAMGPQGVAGPMAPTGPTGAVGAQGPAGPPALVGMADGFLSATGADINGSGKNQLHVSPGSGVTVSFNYAYNRNGYCYGCFEQVLGGLVSFDRSVVPGSISGTSCNNIGNPSGGNISFTFTAPSSVGTYYIGVYEVLDYNCSSGSGGALQSPPTTLDPTHYVGAITVY